MDFEVQEIATQAGGSLSADYNLLPVADEMTGEDTILLALAKDEALETLAARIASGQGRVEAYTPNAVALYNAFLMFGPTLAEGEVVMLANLGEATIDLALVRGTDLLFARNVSGGLGILDGAIAQTFNVRDERARKIRTELLNLDPAARGKYASSQEEKVAHSVQGVSGQIQAALRSTVVFCQAQTNIQDLELSKIFLSGPGARIKGMDRLIQNGLGCTCLVWDPSSQLDFSVCPPEEAALAQEASCELAVVLGLALSPCFEDLYSIEILPDVVKKKLRFMRQTLWNIAAALLVLLYLGYHYMDAKANHAKWKALAGKESSKAKRLKHTDTSTEKLLEENRAVREQIVALHELSVPLHGTVRLLRALREIQPTDFWLQKLESRTGPMPWRQNDSAERKTGRRSKRAPHGSYIYFEGKGVPYSGRNLATDVYSKFKSELEDRVPTLTDTYSTKRDSFDFSGKVDFLYKRPERE